MGGERLSVAISATEKAQRSDGNRAKRRSFGGCLGCGSLEEGVVGRCGATGLGHLVCGVGGNGKEECHDEDSSFDHRGDLLQFACQIAACGIEGSETGQMAGFEFAII